MTPSSPLPIPELFLRHLCVLYHEDPETAVPVQAFLSAAQRAGARWLVVSDHLRVPVPDPGPGKPPQGRCTTAAGIFSPEELASPDRLADRLAHLHEEARAEGFTGLRLVIDQDWLLATAYPERHLFQYETRVNELIERAGIHVLCLYRLSRFPTSFLPNILFLHPFLWQDGACRINPHYLPAAWQPRLAGRGLWPTLARPETPEPEAEDPGRLFDRVRRFAGGLSHELNNMLNVLSLGMDLIEHAPDFPSRLRGDLRDMHDARLRMAQMAGQLAAFSADDPVHLQRVIPCERLNGLVELITTQVKPRLSVEISCDEDVRPVLLDPAQFEQAVLQIARNAAQAGGPDTRLTVRIRNAEAGPADRDGPPPGRYVQFVFTDDGPGIPASVLPHVFEPFFSTRPGQHGMGLPIVVGILKRHRGFLQVTSREERTSFVVWLPAADSPAAAVPEATPAVLAVPDRTITLVEDEPAILRLSERVLTREGYTVRSFSCARDLFAELERSPFTMDLLLTDVVMPGMNGFELFLKMRERWPSLPTVFMSGFTADAFTDGGNLPDGTRFLPKPFLPRALLDCVREALTMGDDDGPL